MERGYASDPGDRELSTEDIAQSRDRAGEKTAAEEGPEERGEAPTYPGEATASAPEAGEPRGQRAGAPAAEEALLPNEDEQNFRARWQEVQKEFVDDPQDAVHTGDALVADVMRTLAERFADHKQELETQWNRGEQVSTEDLRQALQHYRSFFNHLLAA